MCKQHGLMCEVDKMLLPVWTGVWKLCVLHLTGRKMPPLLARGTMVPVISKKEKEVLWVVPHV